MTVGIAIAHAGWDERRKPGYARLIGQADSYRTSESTTREHASVWATRIWQRGVNFWQNDHVVFLNDDVILSPDFRAVCEVLTRLVPDDVIAMHTTAPQAKIHRGRWLRSYWVTGPAYCLPRGRLPDLLSFADKYAALWETDNEDGMMMQWLWEEQTPAYHCIPALVKHDVSVPSTLGYDNHALRATEVAWDTCPDVDLLDSDGWRQGLKDAPLVECPWRSMKKFRAIQLRRGRPAACTACESKGTKMVEFQNGNAICMRCLSQSAAMAILGVS